MWLTLKTTIQGENLTGVIDYRDTRRPQLPSLAQDMQTGREGKKGLN